MTSEERALNLMEWLNTDDEEYIATLDKVKDMLDQHAAEAIVEHEKKIDRLEADLKEANFKLYLIHQGLTTTCLNTVEKEDE